MEYDNTNRGAIFKNERQTNDRQPGYTGSLDVEGKEYWMSAWVKTAKSGKKYFSVAITPKDDNGGGSASADDNEEAPF